MQTLLRGPLVWCAFVATSAVSFQACGDDASSGGSGGTHVITEGGLGGSDNDPSAGTKANGGSSGKTNAGAAGQGDAGAPLNPGGGGNGADAGAGGNAGAGGGTGTTCHVSWTGAASGEADCTHFSVCQKKFLSVNIGDPAPPAAPLKSIQLVYSPDTDLVLGTSMATGFDTANNSVQTTDPGVMYGTQLDADMHLTGGTSMTVTLTELHFSTDPNDVCSGTAHGSLTTVLRERDAGAVFGDKLLTLHAEF